MNRNEFIEADGLTFESDTHEWFIDKATTQYARKDCGLNEDALPTITCFNVRNKTTGEYNKVVTEQHMNRVIYDDEMGCVTTFIDKLKVLKRFDRNILLEMLIQDALDELETQNK